MRQSRFYNPLLRGTLTFAKETVPYYERTLKDVDVESVTSVGDLAAVPMLTKAQVRQGQQDIVSRAVHVEYVQNTSGTTGEVLILYRAREEVEFRTRFYSELRSRYPTYGKGMRDLRLNLSLPVHGTFLPTDPADGILIMQCAVDANSCRNSLELLRQRYCIPGYSERIRSISGFSRQILIFTAYCREHGIDTLDFGIKTIYLSGDYLSHRIRSYLEASWGATVQDAFGVSEIFGSAWYRKYCRGFVFSPLVVPEVVDPITLQPLEEGEGLLLLTTLYPFVQAQPFIRYKTGDIVRKQSFNGVENFAYLGREQHCLSNPFGRKYELLLSGVDLYESFDGKPYVRKSGASYGVALRDRSPLSRPIVLGVFWITRAKTLRAAIFAEANEDPGANSTMFTACARTVCDELIQLSPALRQMITQGMAQLDVYFVAPQQLASHLPGAMSKTDVGWSDDIAKAKSLELNNPSLVGSSPLQF